LPDVDASLEELSYALDVLGLDGFVLFTNSNGVYLGDPVLESVFEELERRETVVYVHPNPSPDPAAHSLGLPDNLLDFPTDTNRAVAQMHYTNRFARTPRVKYIFSHAGGSIPYLAARFAIIDEMGFIAGGEQRGTAADMFRRIYWDTALATSDPVLRMLRDVAGINQVLYGTDFPYLRRDLQSNSLKNTGAEAPWLTIHPLSHKDSVGAAVLRSTVAPMKGKVQGTAGRGPFNDIMERVAVPDGVTFDAATVGGIHGWWANPAQARKGATIIHAHGGWFNLGTAQAYRNFVGHIALNAGADAFIPEYRLAPEDPFPAAIRDLEACYCGLVDKGITKIALTGDSAGGNLALVLLSIASARDFRSGIAPMGALAFSPVTDLALTGESYDTRAEADPFFTRSQVAGLVRSYLGETDPKNPLASPLYGDLSGLPPIHVHVGDDEVLLDDSHRYVERAVAAGVDAKLEVWMGMPHGFVTNVGGFNAATQALKASGAFLNDRLELTGR
jgi:epsilon-lactone hydrolase